MTTFWVPALASLISTVVGAIVGGFCVHKLTMSRELVAARGAKRTDYLISVYRQLANAANRRSGMSQTQIDCLEAALADVILLGEKEEIVAAREFIVGMAETRSAELDPLLGALRTSLRRELELSEVAVPAPYSLRIEQNQSGTRRVRR